MCVCVCVCVCVYLVPVRKVTWDSHTHCPAPNNIPFCVKREAGLVSGRMEALLAYYYGIGSQMNHLLELLSALRGMVPGF